MKSLDRAFKPKIIGELMENVMVKFSPIYVKKSSKIGLPLSVSPNEAVNGKTKTGVSSSCIKLIITCNVIINSPS